MKVNLWKVVRNKCMRILLKNVKASCMLCWHFHRLGMLLEIGLECFHHWLIVVQLIGSLRGHKMRW